MNMSDNNDPPIRNPGNVGLFDKIPAHLFPMKPAPLPPGGYSSEDEINLEKEWDTCEIVEVVDTGDLADTESVMSDDYRNSRSKKPQVLLSKKDNYPTSIKESDSYDYDTCDSQTIDTYVPVSPEIQDLTAYEDMLVPPTDPTEDLVRTDSGKDLKVRSVSETGTECQIPDNVQSTEPVVLPDVVQPVVTSTSLIYEEMSQETDAEVASLQKIPDKVSSIESKIYIYFLLFFNFCTCKQIFLCN